MRSERRARRTSTSTCAAAARSSPSAARRRPGYAFGIGFGRVAYLGSASAEDGEVLLELLASLATALQGDATAVRALVPAGDRRLVDGLLGIGFRVLRACHYMVRGGGTAPPPNYVLMNGDLM